MKKSDYFNVATLSHRLQRENPKAQVCVIDNPDRRKKRDIPRVYDTLSMYVDKCGCLYPEKKKGVRVKEVLVIYTD
jgi:hypothetical protein